MTYSKMIAIHGQAGREELIDRYNRACERFIRTGREAHREEAKFLAELLEK